MEVFVLLLSFGCFFMVGAIVCARMIGENKETESASYKKGLQDGYENGLKEGLRQGKDVYLAQLELEGKQALKSALTPDTLRSEIFKQFPFHNVKVCLANLVATDDAELEVIHQLQLKGCEVVNDLEEAEYTINGEFSIRNFDLGQLTSKLVILGKNSILWPVNYQTPINHKAHYISTNVQKHASELISNLIQAIELQNKLNHVVTLVAQESAQSSLPSA